MLVPRCWASRRSRLGPITSRRSCWPARQAPTQTRPSPGLLSHGMWLTLRVGRIGNARDTGGTGHRRHHRGDALLLSGPVQPAFGRSERERELLHHLASGSNTRDVARQMFVPEHTAQDHLKSIFAKTSARSGRTLLLRALAHETPACPGWGDAAAARGERFGSRPGGQHREPVPAQLGARRLPQGPVVLDDQHGGRHAGSRPCLPGRRRAAHSGRLRCPMIYAAAGIVPGCSPLRAAPRVLHMLATPASPAAHPRAV